MAASLIIINLVHFIFVLYFGGFRKVDDIPIHFLIFCWIDMGWQQEWISLNTKKALLVKLKRIFKA